MNGMAGIEAFWGICIDAGQWKTTAEDPGIFYGDRDEEVLSGTTRPAGHGG